MMNWKAGLLVALVSVCGFMGAGCGGDNNDSGFFPTPPLQEFPNDTRTNVLVLPNTQIRMGQVTPVEIQLFNPRNVAGLQGRILYDASVVEVVNPQTLPGQPNPSQGGVLGDRIAINYEENRAPVDGMRGITFGVINTGEVSGQGGTLFRLYVRPRAGVAANSATALSLDPDFRFVMANMRGETLPANVTEGSLIVSP